MRRRAIVLPDSLRARYPLKMDRRPNGNVIEQLALVDLRIERVQQLLARRGGTAETQTEGQRTLVLLEQSRQLLLANLT